MREIKFRAWDGKNIIYNQFMISAYGCINKVEPARDYHSWKNENWVLMQYTGLKDKNGKHIYEGDVVKLFSSTLNEKFIRQVGYDEERMCFNFESGIAGYELDNFDEIEIIGNIYENPELLKETDK